MRGAELRQRVVVYLIRREAATANERRGVDSLMTGARFKTGMLAWR